MTRHAAFLVLAGWFVPAFAQTAAFEVASVTMSDPAARGSDGITVNPGRLSARKISLKELLVEAYGVSYYQISGGPEWLNAELYDVEAKSETPASADQMRLMLRTLLTERFKLAIHRERKEMRVYALTVGKGGPRIHAVKEGDGAPANPNSAGVRHFHCEMYEFAGILSTRPASQALTISISK